MRNFSKIAAILTAFTVLVVCLELFGGMIVLKNGYQFSGRVLKSDDKAVVLGYQHGTLTVSKKYISRVVQVQNLSDYGKQLLPPSDAELAALERMLWQAPGTGTTREAAPEKEAALLEKLKTVRHKLEAGNWEFSFELPANWRKSEKGNVLVLSSGGEKNRVTACVTVHENPPVTLYEQAQLLSASARMEMVGLSVVYAVTREAPGAGAGECSILGVFGGEGNQTGVHILLRRTDTHTFILTFCLPPELYREYRPVTGRCVDSVRLTEIGE